ncbi:MULTISPECIES: HEPN/Toprim-associated domain-containing protein [Paraburkholderia]|uniref:HEPN/Toprim-associated domain-containing protein n=1 Tax=Paraburkholderia TaxID=1822464 RepID=UPI0032181AEC
MTCSSQITIGGYELVEYRRTYEVWRHFKPEDRIIRPGSVPDSAYSVTADVLRKRLGRAGFTRTTLEQEFQRFYHAACHLPRNLFFRRCPESAAARAEAFRTASLDDWLEALDETVRAGLTVSQRSMGWVAEPRNMLVSIITGPDWPSTRDLVPQHELNGFPCSSLDAMAVALLEVTPASALCEQRVTMFVEFDGDTSFDDMKLRKQPRQQSEPEFDDI